MTREPSKLVDRGKVLEPQEAHFGMTVRVREDRIRSKPEGVPGTVQKSNGASDYLAVDVQLVVSEGHKSSKLPFGYYLERDADLLILRRAGRSFVAAFSARSVDFFEVEATVWEDAD